MVGHASLGRITQTASLSPVSKAFVRSMKTATRSIIILFDALLLNLAYRGYHVSGAEVCTESTLGFRQVFQDGDDAAEDDPSQDLPSD